MARRKPRSKPSLRPQQEEPPRGLRETRDHGGEWDPDKRAIFLGRTNSSSHVAAWVLEAVRRHDASGQDRGVAATAWRVGVGPEQVRAARAQLAAEEADG
jgi:hypothetical protein